MAQSFNVTEPLTKRLSGLLKEYPPGITILRELLQNADDAGATKISYCIDRNSYPTNDLVDRGLAEYQGPSLLVYNNSIFSDTDFDSLKRLGDSQKVQEKIATGKFGLGFSSVYGWTDSPQILTGSNFVALCPHCTLQEENVRGTTGVLIEFVSACPSNADSIAAFSLFVKDPQQPFNGTVVRLPLRTQEQAKTSKIIELAITPDDVLKEFKAFQKEVAESLLFLKNIEIIEFHIDNQFLGVAEITNVAENFTARTAIKTAINASTAMSLAFQLHMRHRYHHNQDNIDLTQRYHVQHKLVDINTYKSSKEFKEWATKERFFPWIALAAPLDPQIAIQSSIFVSLPLPIVMKDNRVNIHGMFALSRDRRSLWTMMDAQSGGKITNEIQWNTYLFNEIVPVVWQDMLVELAKLGRPVYDYFPIITPRELALDETLAKDVLDLTLQKGNLIWYANTNIMVSLECGLVALEEPSHALLDALKAFSIPVVNNIPGWLISLIRNSKHPYTPLTPSSVRTWLRSRLGIVSPHYLNIPMAVELLKYILNDKKYNEVHNLPLFPCRDGRLRALTSISTTALGKFEDEFYVSTEEEFILFGGNGKQFLDLSVCHKTLAQQIERDIDKISTVINLRRFDLDVFRLYARDHGLLRDLPGANDIDMSGTINFAWVNRVWKWLDSRGAKDKVANVLDGLYLIPLQDTKKLYKIVKPYGSRPLLTSAGPGGTLILQIFEKCERQFPLVDERLKVPSTGFLRTKRCIADSRDLSTTLQWITPLLVCHLPFSLRDDLRHQFSRHLHRRESSKFTKEEKDKLIDLPIYKTLVLGGSLSSTCSYISLNSSSSSQLMAVPQLPVTPVLSGIQLLDAADEGDARLLTELGHTPVPTKTFLEKYVVPNIEDQPLYLMDPLIRFIFDNVTVNETWYKQLENTAFIAVRSRDGIPSSTRRKPSEVIDHNSAVAGLFFDDEEVFGDGIYAAGTVYHNHLKILGVKSHFDAEIADNRIREFANIETCEELYKKCELLLECLSDRGSSVPFESEWKDLLKLPAISVDGSRVVLRASECRPESFKPVVENALGIVPIYVKPALQNDLGWNALLEPNVLGKRIDAIVTRSTLSTIETVLLPIFEYIKSKTTELGNQIGDYVNNIKSHISVQAYIPGSIEGLWPCDKVFFQDAHDFEPYITILPRSYAPVADVIKLFGVADYPSPQCLVNILSQLPTNRALEATELDISIKILCRVQWFDDVDSTQLRIPGTDGRLYPINEFSPSNHVFAHPQVPEAFAFKYQIPRVHDDTAFLQHLSETDVFEDYCQEEQITIRIANTLKEYSLSTSFSEFIANAEDCGSATRVCLYLDAEDIRFPSDNLFSEALSAWQTPSFYVYNDGVFSEDDFKAFINTGAGSKADDSSKIGRHGLGSLTMYHFTDVPSMISGGYFIIFDPSRTYLPLRQGRRRAGMRIPLSLIKTRHRDHLVPFTGIGGYSPDMSNFEGTIFRFPLRYPSQFKRSPLVSKLDILKYSDLSKQLDQTYFHQAKRSLILLTNLNQIEYHLGSTESSEMMSPKHRQFHSQWKVASEVEKNWTPDVSRDKTSLEDIKSMNLRIISGRSFPERSIEKNSWLIVAGFLSQETLQQESLFLGMAIAEGMISRRNHRAINSIPDVAVATQLSIRLQHSEKCSYYSSLPLPAPSGLPIICHGHFSTSSDRRSIRIDGASGDWNRFLAETCLPELYFALLEHLCINNNDGYYSFWPSSTPAENGITQSLQSSFWRNVRYSSRQLILSDNNRAVTISQTIFDGRMFASIGSLRDGAVVQAVRCLRPFSVVLYNPKLNAGLLRHSDDENSRDGVDINVLNPAFVRELLRESSAKSVLSCYDDAFMKEILGFVLESGPLERLVGCYIWRLASGDVVKIAPMEGDESKIAYIVDNEGFKLFEHLAGDSLIRPQAINPEVLEKWDLGDDFNIRRLDGSTIDKFVELALPHHPIKIFSSAERAWISDVWKYISTKQFVVKFYERRPTLALKNEKFKFVSSEGLNTLPIMGCDVPAKLSELCSKLNIFILAKSEVEAVVNLSKNWDCEERFLECLLRLNGNDCLNLRQTIRDLLEPNEIKFLREFCLNFYKPSLSSHILSIIRNLPVWDPPISLLVEGVRRQKCHTVSASEALILPNHERFFPDLTPSATKYKFVSETVDAQNIIAELGGSRLNPGEYAFDYILPYLPELPTAAQLKSIRDLLDQLLDLKSYRRSMLKYERLVPDRTGKLRCGWELYSSTNPIFRSSFLNDDTAFPHIIVDSLPLEEFGVQSIVTKANFFHCVQRLESDVQGEEGNQETVWMRCHGVWRSWNQEHLGLSWTAQELERLANIRFVPLLQSLDNGTYRDECMNELRGQRVIATMNEVISPAHLPIAWTQRIVASVPPARFLEPIGFTPTVVDVVEHLIQLSTLFASKCSQSERNFFKDLAATYDYLNQPTNIAEASEYLQAHHSQQPIWLNDDISLKNATEFIQAHDNSTLTAASLAWLPSSSILHGVPYDLPTYGLYSAKLSLEPYRNLLRACGSHVVENIKAVISSEGVENHGQFMMERMREMLRKQDNMCDMKIVIEGNEHHAHRVLLGAVSPYFYRLCCGDWKEKSTGVLSLDGKSYGTSDSVRSVIEWVYNGFLELDDGVLEDEDDVKSRLDHYLDVLELSNVWDIPELRAHIANRILTYAHLFVRVENVTAVYDIAGRYNVGSLKEYCEGFIEQNKRVVELVDNSGE